MLLSNKKYGNQRCENEVVKPEDPPIGVAWPCARSGLTVDGQPSNRDPSVDKLL